MWTVQKIEVSKQYVDKNTPFTTSWTADCNQGVDCLLGIFTPEGYLIGDIGNTPQTRSLYGHAVTAGGCDESILTIGRYTITPFDPNTVQYDCTTPELSQVRQEIGGPEVYIVNEYGNILGTSLNVVLIAFLIFGFSTLLREIIQKK